MDRMMIGIFLVLGAIAAIATQAPPKVYENVKTYYKTLIQAPAAQVNAYSNHVIHKPRPAVVQPVAKPPAKKPNTGPQISVLGGISWDREPHASRKVVAPAPESEASATQEPAAVPPQEAPVQDQVTSTSEEQAPQAPQAQ